MLGLFLNYAWRYPGRAIRALGTDPLGTWEKVRNKLAQGGEDSGPAPVHEADPDWEKHLHQHLGVAWPCEATWEFHALWPDVVGQVAGAGIDVGPESFNGFNDGDAGLVRAIWCLIRHAKPVHVVETGVAHGFTSRFILEALEKNGTGHLSSIDLPPLDPVLQRQVGIAVGGRYPKRWTLIAGSSRRHLPSLLARLGGTDLFIHDSLHTERNVRFELDRAWAALRPRGALVVDDIDSNWGFHSFLQAHPRLTTLVCEAEPIRPDTRRFNQKGLFGIILKPASA